MDLLEKCIDHSLLHSAEQHGIKSFMEDVKTTSDFLNKSKVLRLILEVKSIGDMYFLLGIQIGHQSPDVSAFLIRQ